MQQKDTDHNLKLEHFIDDEGDAGDPILRRNVKPRVERRNTSTRRNASKRILGAVFFQLQRVTKPLKVSILLFLVISIALHLFVIEGLYYRASQSKANEVKGKAEEITLKITPPPEPSSKVRKAIAPKPVPEPQKKKVPDQAITDKKHEFKQLSKQKLVELGQEHMDMVREGIFPALILSYRSPISYVREMYALGAKTVIYNTVNREFHDINLLDGSILPLSGNDFKGFSLIKRVIKDVQWNNRKYSAASRLKSSPDSLEILLLLPMTVEAQWIGHQVNLLTQMKIKIEEVQTVEAQFQDAKFKLLYVHLKDGSSRRINDRG